MSIYDIIENFLKPNELQKKKNGEVFTPLELIREKCSKVPEEFWRDKNVKVLDPCCGIGNYQVVLIEFFMKGLVEEIKDERERLEWIKTRIIYCSDICALNVALCKKITGVENVYCMDFLEKNTFDEMKFDMVIGNPPYQEECVNKKHIPIWHKFVKKSFTILKNNGYLVFVHPSGWRSPSGIFKDVYNTIMTKTVLYLSMNDFKKGREKFSSGTNYDFYCICNKSPCHNYATRVNDIDNNDVLINLNLLKFIPSGCFNLFIKLISDQDKDKVDVLYSRSAYGSDKKHMESKINILYSSSAYESRKPYMENKKIQEFEYPCVYTITQKDGLKLYYSSKKDIHFNIPKVIWTNGGGTYPIIDKNGDYGLTQFAYGIVDEIKNLEKIKEAMESEKFINLMKYVKITDNHKYNYKIISMFKKDFYNEFL